MREDSLPKLETGEQHWLTLTKYPIFSEEREHTATLTVAQFSSSYSKMRNIWQAQLERLAQRTDWTESLEDSVRRARHSSPTEFIQYTTTRDRERCKDILDFNVGRITTTRDREESNQLRRSQSNNISDSPYAAFFRTVARQPRSHYSNLRESANQRQSNQKKQYTAILTAENGKQIQHTQHLATLSAETEHWTQQFLKQVCMV